MFKRSRARLSGLATALAFAGCSTFGPDRPVDPGLRGHRLPLTVLPEVPRDPPLAIPKLPPPVSPSGKDSASSVPYRGLSAQDCLRLAAASSTVGNLLDLKARECAQAGHSSSPDGCNNSKAACDHGAGDVRGAILQTAAIEARAQAAVVGLELYFRLAQAEGQAGVARDGLARVDSALKERDRLEAKGLAIPGELDALRTRRIDLLASRAEADRAAEQLSIELRHRLNLAPESGDWRIQPLVDLEVDPRSIDPEAAIREGLANRPELILFRRLDRMQPPETLHALQGVLGTVNPLLGLNCEPTPPVSLLSLLRTLRGKTEPDPASLLAIRTQWNAYRIERERDVIKEIRLAALSVRSALREIAVAQERVRTWQGEIDQFRAKESMGLPAYAGRVNAELKQLEARATLWGKVVAWHVALVKLRQAQGLLLR